MRPSRVGGSRPKLRRIAGPRDAAFVIDPALWVERVLGVAPDDWQAQALRARQKEVLILMARQGAKSTTVGWRIAHRLAFHENSTSLVIAPTAKQSAEIVRKVMASLDQAGVPLTVRNTYGIETKVGSRVVAVPGGEDASGARGFSVDGELLVDEACFVDERIIAAVRPMLAVAGGTLFAVTSAGPASSWFAQRWRETEDDPAVLRITRTAYANPRIEPAFLERERRALGEARFASEYLNTFSTPGSRWCSPDTVATLFGEPVGPEPLTYAPPNRQPAITDRDIGRLFGNAA